MPLSYSSIASKTLAIDEYESGIHILNCVIYYPFIKMYDKQKVQEEQAALAD